MNKNSPCSVRTSRHISKQFQLHNIVIKLCKDTFRRIRDGGPLYTLRLINICAKNSFLRVDTHGLIIIILAFDVLEY